MTKPVLYNVLFTETYTAALRSIKRHGRSIIEEIQDKAEDLALFPEKKGKPLVKTLAGLWSRRAYHQRYRIIYRINEEELTVEILYAGIRKAGSRDDVYEKTKKLKR
jgi:mRNA-degrading endonuclease RelE of RelBE toxin-antitoxin system